MPDFGYGFRTNSRTRRVPTTKIPVFFPVTREFGFRDEFSANFRFLRRAIAREEAGGARSAVGHKLKIEYATAGVVEQTVAADDEIDVAILTKPRVDKLVREAKIVGGTTKTLASAQIGLAVKKGATKPDISS